MPTQRDIAGAALLGAAGGMRTFTGPGVLAARSRILAGTPARYAAIAAAAGEYAADKSPIIPTRVSAPSLVARCASGAFGGGVLAGPAGAVAGGATAFASTFAAFNARKGLGQLTGVPDPLFGVAEDGLALALAGLATRPQPEADEPEQDPQPKRLARGIVRGLAAGAVGTAAMTGAQLAVMRATGGKPSRTPEKVGRKVARGIFNSRVKRSQRSTLNQAMHWIYGTAWG